MRELHHFACWRRKRSAMSIHICPTGLILMQSWPRCEICVLQSLIQKFSKYTNQIPSKTCSLLTMQMQSTWKSVLIIAKNFLVQKIYNNCFVFKINNSIFYSLYWAKYNFGKKHACIHLVWAYRGQDGKKSCRYKNGKNGRKLNLRKHFLNSRQLLTWRSLLSAL